MFGFFKQQKKQRTMLDDVQEVSRKLIVKGYRRIALERGCAPTAKTTDDKIMEIYTKVNATFSEAEGRRCEHIPANIKNFIVLKFLQLYEMSGDQFMEAHLGYELDKYLKEGLRPDYKQEVALFDQESNDPEVRQLRELHRLANQQIGRERPALAPKELRSPYSQIAQTALRASVDTAQQCVEIAEKAAVIKLADPIREALLKEIVAYNLRVAIAYVMAKNNLPGREGYDQVEAGLVSAIVEVLRKPGDNLEQYLPVVSKANRDLARMYFLTDWKALNVSEEEIARFAERLGEGRVKELLVQQADLVLFMVRGSRLLQVNAEIESAVVYYVSQMLGTRALELQEEVARCLA